MSSPTPDEAAAALAAVEQFLADTAVAAAPQEETLSGWVRAARLEAVDREPDPRWA